MASYGAVIIDNLGRPVWFSPFEQGVIAKTDFRVQTYQGKPVLTWIQSADFVTNKENTAGYILDDTYTVIAKVFAGNGLKNNRHEFQLTPQGTALVTIYNIVNADLSVVGGSTNGRVIEGVVQEIDIPTGKVLLEWHSLADVPLTDSYEPAPLASNPGQEYDYLHLNSASLDADGNLLVSGRHTWTIYKINRATGRLMWRLGGKRSDFSFGPGVAFAWQHNAIAADATTIRLFDNESNSTPVLPYSRALWVRRDEKAMTATVARTLVHPDRLSSSAMGDVQSLDNGDTFVGWGNIGRFSEFDAQGALIFDAQVPAGSNTYRAYRFRWSGRPTTVPTVTAQPNADGTMTLHAIWNGATEVVTWRVLGGSAPTALTPVTSAAWNGLDTTIAVPGQYACVQIVALDATGASLGSSSVQTIPLPATIQSARLINISTRVQVGGAAGIPIAGFALSGTGSKKMIVRAVGPALTAYGLTGTLGDPSLTLSAGTVAIASNDNWNVAEAATMAAVGAFALPAGSKDAAVALSLAAGAYTARIGAPSGTGGIALLEVYDADSTAAATIANVSTRAYVGAGAAALISGFVVSGEGSVRLLIRGVGPTLTGFGVTGVLADPVITLNQGSTVITSNDNWSSAANAAEISAAATAVSAFALPANSKDAAIVTRLPAGAYTAVVNGAANSTGTALVEIYLVP